MTFVILENSSRKWYVRSKEKSLPTSREVTRNEAEGKKIKEYNESNIPLAKTLRKNMTPWHNL